MTATPYTDEAGPVVPGETKVPIDTAVLVIAANGIPVYLSGKHTALFAVEKGTLHVRRFSKRISTNWLARRVDEFAESISTSRSRKRHRKSLR